MKRTIRFLCILMVISILVGTNVITKAENNPLVNVDPFGIVQNNPIFGGNINSLIDELEEGIDYEIFEYDERIVYALRYYFSYMDFPEETSCNAFCTSPDSNSINEIIYYFSRPEEESALLSNSFKKMIEEIEEVYGMATSYTYYPDGNYSDSFVDYTKTLTTVNLRNGKEGSYSVYWNSDGMEINLYAVVDPETTYDHGFISFKVYDPLNNDTYGTQIEGVTYELEEMGLSISIPSMFDVFTRNIFPDDAVLAKYGVKAAELKKYFVESGTYLNAARGINVEDIIITMEDEGFEAFEDFDTLSDNTLSYMAIAFKEDLYAKQGITISEYDYYHHPQLSFIRFYFYNPYNFCHCVQYLTIKDKKAMFFTLCSYDGAPTLEEKNRMCTVMDSIVMNHKVQNDDIITTSSAFIYTDDETGVTFTVPDNWEIKPLSEEAKLYFDLILSSTQENALSIWYGSNDHWSKLTPSQKKANPRSTINNSSVTQKELEEWAEAYGADPSTIREVIYNGKSYFIIEGQGEVEVRGKMVPLTDTLLVRYENGWEYTFYFAGSSYSRLFGEFESILESVEYP